MDPIDWCLSSKHLTNVTLTLTGGVVVAFYDLGPALTLWSGSKVIGRGDPIANNRLLPYYAVQERAVVWGTFRPGALFDLGESAPATAPEIDLRFTSVDLFQSNGGYPQDLLNSDYSLGRLSLVDCRLRGGNLYVIPAYDYGQSMAVGLTNSLLQWTTFLLWQGYLGDNTPMVVHLRNCLFSTNSVAALNSAINPIWSVQDCLFDTVAHQFSVNGGVTNSYNGYFATTNLPSPTTGNVTLSALDFQTGALGPWYYPTNGANLNTLRDIGSRNATNATLFAFTTTTNNVAETNSTVDIGFHSMAVTLTGSLYNPLDTDGDTFFDWWEDYNLNGSYDASAGETDWQSYNSRYGIGVGPGLVIFTPLK
jgi:hypothetical protein